MEPNILSIIIALVALIIGAILGKVLFAKNTKKQVAEAEQQAQKIIADGQLQAENLKKEKLLEAKEKFVQLKGEHDKEVLQRNQKIIEGESRIKQKEQSINQKDQNLEKHIKDNEAIKETLNRQIEVVNTKRTELEKHQEEHIRRLEKVAGLSAEDAKTQLIESLKQEAQTKAVALQQEIIEDAKLKANKEARKIVIQTIQRTAAEAAIENAITVFNLESDEIKGSIIGREGRNIRAIEAATGVDLIVDDTPEAIVLSSFDPLRREIARLSLQRLVADGRIHPARIEEVVEKTKRQLDDQVMEIGERTAMELGVHGLHKELVRMVGRMRFRSSYGQNLLMHSRETANLCAIMAAELGMNPKLAKRAGLAMLCWVQNWPKNMVKTQPWLMPLVPTTMRWKCNTLSPPLFRPAMPLAVQGRVQGVK
jgi:ribonucrease Y